MNLTLFEFYADLRNELLEVIGVVENSKQGWGWDNTQTNWCTQRKLENLFDKYSMLAACFDIHVVKRHSPCGNPRHDKYGDGGYVVKKLDGEIIEYSHSKYSWSNLKQGNLNCVCPCSKDNEKTNHYVLLDVICDKDADQEIYNKMASVMWDIHEAIFNAEDKKPRSSIREYILRAIIKINDELLPQGMDEYIKSMRKKTGSKA